MTDFNADFNDVRYTPLFSRMTPEDQEIRKFLFSGLDDFGYQMDATREARIFQQGMGNAVQQAVWDFEDDR